MPAQATQNDAISSSTPQLPVVGIVGGSGSRQALEMLFRNLPADSGIAFVIVARLGHRQVTELPAVLQKRTEMEIITATDGVLLQPDHVYVTPVGTQVAFEQGEWRLQQPTTATSNQTQRNPLDTFLNSLATAWGEASVAILLSGTGSDGVAGLERMQAVGGLAMIQDPDEAPHPALPRRAVVACPEAIVATAGELARELVQCKGDLADVPITASDEESATFDELYGIILDLIVQQTGHDLSHYKIPTLRRRIARRMNMAGVPSPTHYLDLLRRDAEETHELFQDTLVSVTNFFRDPDAYEMLEQDCIPQLFAEKRPNDQVRVWVAGCATGQEAYSVAMQLVEYAAQVGEPPRLQIFATDLDEEAIAIARRGIYPKAVAEEISPERLERFFTEDEHGYRVKPEIREHVLFAVHDLLKDPPFSRLDLITCRNVLIYFKREAQRKVFEAFHYALDHKRAGREYLFLGTSESADVAPELFTVVDKYCHLYQRSNVASPLRQRQLPSTLATAGKHDHETDHATSTTPTRTLEERYEAWSLRLHMPPRLLVNANYKITHLFGEVSHYLREPEGAVTQNILQRILPDLRLDLRTALFQAFQKGERSISRALQAEVDGKAHLIHLHVGPVTEPGFPEDYAEVAFIADGGANPLESTMGGETVETDLVLVQRLEEELMRTRERLQSIIEEYEDSSHELKTSNEELQSMNEELKSTTEELETSKEELQSMNEELVTVNTELTDKVEELNRVNSDLLNLIASSEVGTIFLDAELRISRFTPQVTELFNLIESDHGRPFAHVTHCIRHPRLPELVAYVLKNGVRLEETVQDEEEHWYNLRIFPYRTVTGERNGVVLSFVDINDLKRAESEERQRLQQQTLVQLGRQALEETDLNVLFRTATQQVAAVLEMELCKVLELQTDGTTLLLREGVGWHAGLVGQATVPADNHSQAGYTLQTQGTVVVRDLTTETRFQGPALLTEHDVRSGMSVTIQGTDGAYGVLGVHSRELRNFAPYDADFIQSVANILAVAITRHATAMALQESEALAHRHLDELEAIYNTAPIGLCVLDRELRWVHINEKLAEINGFSAAEHMGRSVRELLPDLADDAEPLLRQILETEEPVLNIELNGETPAQPGVERTWLEQWYPLHDSAGAVVGINIVAEEITERKRIEAELRQSEERYRYLFENMDDGFCIIEVLLDANDTPIDYLFLEANPSFERHTGLVQAVGKTARELVPGLEEHWVELYGHVALTGEPNRFEQGSEVMGRWFDVYAFRIGAAEERRVAIFFKDISDRKQHEIHLQRSEEHVRNILDNLFVFVGILTPDGIVVEANHTALDAANLTAEDVVGKHFAETYWWSHAESIQTQLRAAIARAAAGEVVRYDVRIRLGESEYIVIDFMLGSVCDTEGNVSYLIPSGVDITERHLAATALRESEERLQLAMQVANFGIFEQDIVANEVYWSPELRAMHGFSADVRIVADQTAQFVHPEDRAQFMQTVQAAYNAQGDGAFAHEFRILRNDESIRWLYSRGQVYFRGEGARRSPVRVIGVALDITERKEAEAALQKSEEQSRLLSLVVQNSPDFIGVSDINGMPVFVNKAALQLIGATWEGVLETPVPDYFVAAEQPFVRDVVLPTVLRKGRWSGELTFRHWQTGQSIPVLYNVFRVDDPTTSEPTHFATITRDLTEQKAAEMALRQSEARFRSAFEQAAVGMAHLDIEGHYLRVNDRLCDILGYSRAELLQKTFMEITHPDDLEVDLAAMAQQVRGELPHHSMEKRYLHKDGSYLWTNMTAAVVFDEAEEPDYGIVVVQDISARKVAEQALLELTVTLDARVHERTAELERSNLELDQFAYVASHDLKAPLRGIDHLAGWIMEDVGETLPPTSRQHLETLRGRVHRMDQLLEDLLLYSRVGRQPTQIEVVNSHKLIRQLVDLLNPPATFTVTIVEPMPTFRTRRVPLELVLRNLIGNAIKHHHRDDGQIEIAAQEQEGWVEFRVQDDGPGIDLAFHKRMFQLFQTLQPRDEVEGSGIGLAIVKKAVDLMGGEITVDSAEGEGTSFRFTWPVINSI